VGNGRREWQMGRGTGNGRSGQGTSRGEQAGNNRGTSNDLAKCRTVFYLILLDRNVFKSQSRCFLKDLTGKFSSRSATFLLKIQVIF
jgi:hypothetical protein